VVGINEQIESQVQQSSGVSFAIPSNLVKLVADGLIKSGHVQHTFLGISSVPLTLDVLDALKLPENTRGAYVESVQPGSPAEKSGLRGGGTNTVAVNGADVSIGGDIITAIDNQPIKTFDDLTSYLFTKTQVGQTITLTVLRNGKTENVQVTLAARPSSAAQ
jgi:2-alkenal reductase